MAQHHTPNIKSFGTNGKLAYLETGFRSSDLILECFSGHIALFELNRLQGMIHTQPDGFIEAVHQDVYAAIEKESDRWASNELIKINAGWVGRHLLLIGFPFEVQENIANSRFNALCQRFSELSHFTFSDRSGEGRHEIFTGNLGPVFSMVTKPKLMSYENLAAILINDLQRRKSTTPGRGPGFPSAMWMENPIQAIRGKASSPEERSAIYHENTRQLLRTIFRNRKIRLGACAIEHPISGKWVGLGAHLDGLDTLIHGSGLIGESAWALCQTMAMTWELETAMLDQLLYEIQNAGGLTGLPPSFRINLPVSWETLLCWANFPADLDDILNNHNPNSMMRVRLVLSQTITNGGELTQKQMDRIRVCCEAMRNRYHIEVGEVWTTNSHGINRSEALGIRAVTLRGEMITADGAQDRIQAFMEYRNKIQRTWHVTLGHEADPDLARLAGSLGVDALEVPLSGELSILPNTLVAASRSTKAKPGIELIDARARFLRMATPHTKTTDDCGAEK